MSDMAQHHSLAKHDAKVEFLDALAILMNCQERVGSRFPDGACPDVLRVNRRKNLLFIGDAKITEAPGCRQTQARLNRYLGWLSLHLHRPKAIAIFAICFENKADRRLWGETISSLSRELDLIAGHTGLVEFDRCLYVAWHVFRTTLS